MVSIGLLIAPLHGRSIVGHTLVTVFLVPLTPELHPWYSRRPALDMRSRCVILARLCAVEGGGGRRRAVRPVGRRSEGRLGAGPRRARSTVCAPYSASQC